LTVKGRYLGDTESGWRLVAVLRVIQRFLSHEEAASWYERQNKPLPSNCLVDGNPPKPFELTNGDPPAEVKQTATAAKHDFVGVIRLWDATYRQRVARWPVFLATESEFIDLNNPPQLGEQQIRSVFDRIPRTLNPPQIACAQLEHLVQLAAGNNLTQAIMKNRIEPHIPR
jgi:hypothetical protein